jgi:hypothetical protein
VLFVNAWREYKKKDRTPKPWDLLKSANHTTEEISNERFEICLGCDRFIHATKQCKECGCFMNLKTRLREATCPLDKW